MDHCHLLYNLFLRDWLGVDELIRLSGIHGGSIHWNDNIISRIITVSTKVSKVTKTILTHTETYEMIEVDIVATANHWAYTADGYYYDLRYWRTE